MSQALRIAQWMRHAARATSQKELASSRATESLIHVPAGHLCTMEDCVSKSSQASLMKILTSHVEAQGKVSLVSLLKLKALGDRWWSPTHTSSLQSKVLPNWNSAQWQKAILRFKKQCCASKRAHIRPQLALKNRQKPSLGSPSWKIPPESENLPGGKKGTARIPLETPR
jgi:hypothetical protein